MISKIPLVLKPSSKIADSFQDRGQKPVTFAWGILLSASYPHTGRL